MSQDPLADPAPEAALAHLGAAAEVWHPLPGGRTNRLWHVGAYVVKRYDASAASPLFPNDPKAEARALAILAPQGLAPRLRAAGTDWILYDHVPGPTWTVDDDPTAVARMLHRLHSTVVPEASFRPLPNGSRAILSHAASFAPTGLPPPPPDPHLPAVAPCLIHADPVLGNILAAPGGPLLIDWQCPGLGDPAEDLATLLSPAMMWLYSGRKPSLGWAESLLGAYPDPVVTDRTKALLPLYRWRIMAHCAWKADRGDADYATALQIEQDS